MADLRIRLKLEPGTTLKDSTTLAKQVKAAFGEIKVNGNLIDLGDANQQIAALTLQVQRAQAALSDKQGQAEIQRQSALLQEALRFKQQLAGIENAFLTPEDAATAKSLAAELNRLNLQKIIQDFDALDASLSGFRDSSDTIDQLSASILRAQASLSDGLDAVELQRNVSLFQEAARYKQQLAQIENAGFSPEDVASAKGLADELNRLNLEKINGDFDRLAASVNKFGDASDTIAQLTASVASAQATLSSGAETVELQRQAALIQESLRFKAQLASIDNAGFSPEDTARAKELAQQLNSLNIEKLTTDFDNLANSVSSFADGSQKIESLTSQLTQAQIALSNVRAQAGIADQTDTAELQRQASLLQEAARYKAELAQIDNAGFSKEDADNAKKLAASLNQLNIDRIEQEFNNAKGAVEKYQAELARTAEVQSNLDIATASVIGGAGAFAAQIKGLATNAIQTGAAFEQLSAALTTAFGEQKGSKELERIQEFAAKTPFQVDGLTNSFLKLVNRGFVPTNEELTKIGDLAASQSKDFDQLVEAILDAQSGEFERLKEFGIKASQAGDQATFTFRGVTTTVEKNEEAIRNLLISYGNLDGISGSLANQSATLSGQLSNFEDGIDQINVAFFAFAEGGAKEFLGIANQLVGSFLALPTPVKNTVFAVTGFSAVLAAAIAALATYNFAVNSAYVAAVKQAAQQTLNTALLLKDNAVKGVSATLTTAATIANTRLTAAQIAQAVAQLRSTALSLKDNIAKGASVAVQTALALATGQATVAQNAQLATLARGALAFGALAAAIAAVAAAYDTFKIATEATDQTEASIKGLEEGINSYREAIAKVGQGSDEGLKAVEDQINANKQAIEDSLPAYQKFLDKIRGVFGESATVAQDAIDSQSLGFSELVDKIENDVLGAYDDLKAAPGGLARADADQRQALLDNIDKSIAALEAEKPVTEEAAFARNTYLASLRASKAELEAVATSGEAATLSVEEQTKALKSLGETYETQTTSLENANKAQEALIKEGLANQSVSEKEGQEQLRAQEEAYLNQRLALNQQKLKELQALLVKTTDPAALKELQGQIAEAEAQVYDDRIAVAENAAEEQQRVFDEQKKNIEDSTAEELAIQENANKEEEALIQEALARGDIDEEQARKESLAREATYLNNRIALNQEKLAELQKLQSTTTDENQLKEIANQIRQVEGQIYDDRASLAKNAAEERQRIEEEALKKIEDANEEASAQLAQQQAAATAQIRQLQLSGTIDEDEAQRQITALQADAAQQNVAQKEQELAQIRALREQGVLSAEDASDKERDLITEIAQANVSALEAQIALQEAAKQAEIEAVQEAANEEIRANERAVAGYESKLAAIDRASSALQRQSDLLQSQNNLQNALIGLDTARAQATVSRYEQAGQLLQQLNSGELQSQQEQIVAERQLQALGLSRRTSQLELVQRQQEAENQLAEQERAQLDAKQTQERAALELQLQQNELANRRNLLEARRNELAAQRDVIEARAALREAQIQGDSSAIEDAQQQLDLANQSATLATDQVTEAQAQIDAQAQIATNARDALAAQQEAELVIANSTEQARQYANELERAAAAAQRTRPGGGDGAPRGLRVGGNFKAGEFLQLHKDEYVIPSYDGTVLNQRDSRKLMREALMGQQASVSLNTSAKVASTSKPSSVVLRDERLINEVRQLRDEIKAVKKPNVSPTVQIVNSKQPLSDAMKAYNDILAASYRGY